MRDNLKLIKPSFTNLFIYLYLFEMRWRESEEKTTKIISYYIQFGVRTDMMKNLVSCFISSAPLSAWTPDGDDDHDDGDDGSLTSRSFIIFLISKQKHNLDFNHPNIWRNVKKTTKNINLVLIIMFTPSRLWPGILEARSSLIVLVVYTYNVSSRLGCRNWDGPYQTETLKL